MEGLIGSLNKDKWQEISAADRTDDYSEYFINRAHKQVDPTTYQYMIENDTVDKPKSVTLPHCVGDPLAGVSKVELRLSPDGSQIIGMDQDGDIVVLK